MKEKLDLPAQLAEAQKRPQRFTTRAEAMAYIESSLKKGAEVPASKELLWSTSQEPHEKKPRSADSLFIEYSPQYSTLTPEEEDQLAPVTLHERYEVPDDAPAAIKSAAEIERKKDVQLPRAIMLIQKSLRQLRDGTHRLVQELDAVRASGDTDAIAVAEEDFETLTQELEERLKRYITLLTEAEDVHAWDAQCAPAASLLKRAQTLTARIENGIPDNPTDEQVIQFAEDSRELSALMDSGRFAIGDTSLALYLYHHPETEEDRSFESEVREKVAPRIVEQLHDHIDSEVTLNQLIAQGFEFVNSFDEDKLPLVCKQMNPGDVIAIPPSQSEVSADPLAADYLHTMYYRDQTGKCYTKNLRNSVISPQGWTPQKIEDLVSVLQSSDTYRTSGSRERGAFGSTLAHAGFTAEPKNTQIIETITADNALTTELEPGSFIRFQYPQAEIDANPEKAGKIHTIKFKDTDGTIWVKYLTATSPYGVTDADAQVIIASLKSQITV